MIRKEVLTGSGGCMKTFFDRGTEMEHEGKLSRFPFLFNFNSRQDDSSLDKISFFDLHQT